MTRESSAFIPLNSHVEKLERLVGRASLGMTESRVKIRFPRLESLNRS